MTVRALFDEAYYLATNADIAAAVAAGRVASGFDHFLSFGFREARDPNALFDVSYYFVQNPDVFVAGFNPLVHYVSFGAAEGRDPSDFFDTSFYLAQYADVAAAGINPLLHFIQFGGREGRNPSAGFDSAAYLAANADVAAAGVNPLVHYVRFGAAEGRPAFDLAGNRISGPPVIPPGGIGTFAFTTGADKTGGTSGDDLGIAALATGAGGLVPTLGSADAIDLAGGADAVFVTLNGKGEAAAAPGARPRLASLETLQVTATATSFLDAGLIDGLATIRSEAGSAPLTITNVASRAAVTVNDAIGAAVADLSVLYADALVAGTADAITLTVANTGGVRSLGVVNLAGTAAGVFETVNLVSVGAGPGSVIEDLGSVPGLVLAGPASSVANASIAGLTLNITGGRNLSINDGRGLQNASALEGFTRIDASGFNAGLTNRDIGPNLATSVGILADPAADVSVTGGLGSDIVAFSRAGGGSGYSVRDSFFGGPGIDRLQINGADVANPINLIGPQTNLASVEEVFVLDALPAGVTARFQHFGAAGVGTVFLNGSDGAATITFAAGTPNAVLIADAGGTLVLGIEGAGATDTLGLTLSNADVDGSVTVMGAETVALVSTTPAGVAADGGANRIATGYVQTGSGGAATTLRITGSTDLAVGINASIAVGRIDAMDFTGRLEMPAIGGSKSETGITITGGSGNDVLVGTQNGNPLGNQDVIDGGAGNDRIIGYGIGGLNFGFTQADRFTGGPGADTFVFTDSSLAAMLKASSGTGPRTHITDFVAGTDRIALVIDANLDGKADGGIEQIVVNPRQVFFSIDAPASLHAAIRPIPASTAKVLQAVEIDIPFGAFAGRYLYVNDTVAGVSPADDLLIDIRGSSGNLSASDFVFV